MIFSSFLLRDKGQKLKHYLIMGQKVLSRLLADRFAIKKKKKNPFLGLFCGREI
jgi:hypothetical protein